VRDRDEGAVVVSFGPGVSVRVDAATGPVVSLPVGSMSLGMQPAGVVAALLAVERGGVLRVVEDALIDDHGVEALSRWYAIVSHCEEIGALRYEVFDEGRSILRFTPAATGRVSSGDPPAGAVRLSRFAHLRRDGDALILDSPLARGRIEVLDPHVAAAIAATHVPVTVREMDSVMNARGRDWIGAVLSLLIAAGVVLHVDEAGATTEDRSPGARGWEFADLALHARSRTSRNDLLVGGTYRLAKTAVPLAPLPPIKGRMSDDRIVLERPDLAALARTDEPFTRVIENRRSVRRHGERPLTATQLGHFLFRVARAHPPNVTPGAASLAGHAVRFRPYPGGGACHPLEIYPVVGRCEGLETGLYHYDPEAHELEALADPLDGAQELLGQVSVPMDDGSQPQVILVLTARFRRLNWKYEGNAYALLLQEVGVLYQSMYLVATAMRLAPCAVGGGDAARFAQIIGTDPLDEASVGAFTLGSFPIGVRPS